MGDAARVKHCKSCKFKDLPTIGQLIEQLELVQNRMENVCTYQGDLDIRAQFGNYNAANPHNRQYQQRGSIGGL